MVISFQQTTLYVTMVAACILVLYRLIETSMITRDETLECVLELADRLYNESMELHSSTVDSSFDRLELLHKALGLLQVSRVQSKTTLSDVGGYDVNRRIKHIEREMARVRRTIAHPT